MQQLEIENSRGLGIIAFVLVALIIGSIPAVTKDILISLPPAVQLAVRFGIGAAIFTPSVCHYSSRKHFSFGLLRDGGIIGCLLFGVFACATIGLETISANRTAFIFGLPVVFITIYEVLLRRRFSIASVAAAILAFVGTGVMSWEQSQEPLSGSLWVLACTLFATVEIILLEKIAIRYSTSMLTAVELWTVAILCLLWSAPQIGDRAGAIRENLGALVYLGVVATALVLWLYNFALQRISAYEASLVKSLEPVFGAIISFILLGETFHTRGILGALLVLGGLVLAAQGQYRSAAKNTISQTE